MLQLGKLYYDRGEFVRLAKILKQLHQSCQVLYQSLKLGKKSHLNQFLTFCRCCVFFFLHGPGFSILFVCWFLLLVYQTDDGQDDLKKGTQLLEIYALEIQMYTAQVH